MTESNSQEAEKKGKDNDCYGNNSTYYKNSKMLHNGNSENLRNSSALKPESFSRFWRS